MTLDRLIADHGALILFANVFLTQAGLPMPAVPTMIVGGAMAMDGRLSAPLLVVLAIVASLAGDAIWYVLGRRLGSRVMRALCRLSLTPDWCVSQTQTRFERWGSNALLVAKFVPGLATIAPPLAGATGIGWPRFLALSTAGAAVWVAAALGVGMVFRREIDALLAALDRMGTTAAAIIAALVAVYVAYKWWQRRRFFAMLRMARISVDELWEMMGAGQAPLVVDVRSPTARLMQPHRIPGAVHVPLAAIDDHARQLPRNREIILYCTCPNEVSAAEAAKLLMMSGFTHVRPLAGGLDAWIDAGYSVEELDPDEAARAAHA
jgi:membrane protein DedA with SNARE-associated domain/rhodanese-related sulfurtransferase